MPKKRVDATGNVALDLRITLRWVRPEIWRLIRVPHDVRLDRLHHVLQTAFGWTNSHLHQFIVGEPRKRPERYIGDVQGARESGFADDLPPTDDERKCTLDQLLVKPGDRLDYEYDFGDGWHHEIALVAVTPQAMRLSSALCLDGARAGPPEDCGGPPGYENFVAAVADPKHPEHDDLLDWIGGEFDPEAFDRAKTNRALTRLKV